MIDDLAHHDKTCTDLTSQMEGLLRASGNEIKMDENQAIDEAALKLRSMKATMDLFKIEIQKPGLGMTAKENYTQRYKIHLESFKRIKNDLEFRKQQVDKNSLFSGGSAGFGKDGAAFNVKDANSVMSYGLNKQADTTNRLHTILATLKESERIGIETQEKLVNQQEQLGKINDDLLEITDELKAATSVLKSIGRRMLCDKYIWVIAGLVVLAVVGIIIWKAVNPNAGANVPSGLTNNPTSAAARITGSEGAIGAAALLSSVLATLLSIHAVY